MPYRVVYLCDRDDPRTGCLTFRSSAPSRTIAAALARQALPSAQHVFGAEGFRIFDADDLPVLDAFQAPAAEKTTSSARKEIDEPFQSAAPINGLAFPTFANRPVDLAQIHSAAGRRLRASPEAAARLWARNAGALWAALAGLDNAGLFGVGASAKTAIRPK